MAQTPTQRRLVRTAAGFNKKAERLRTPGRLSAYDLAYQFQQQHGACFYCGVGIDLFACTFDHRQPFERGGSNQTDNVVATCLQCNRQKFMMTEAEFRDWLALERMCRSCGKVFKPRASDYRRGYGYYCSRKCSGRAGGLAA